ncbi:MAG: hypothetical protein Q9203_003448 [Teloschistes exilis]
MAAARGSLKVGVMLASVLFVPLFLVTLYYFVTRWGWWKLYRMGPQRPLVRTWHGWVESGDKKTMKRLHKFPPPSCVVPRTTTADYRHVFWDPTGEKQKRFQQERDESILRYAPRWLRSSAYSSTTPSAEADGQLQAEPASGLRQSDHSSATDGLRSLALMGRRWDRGWRAARRYTDLEAARPYDGTQESYHTCLSGPQQGPELHAASSTIRRRRPMRRATVDWDSHGGGVERATKVQLLAPTAGAEHLVRLFERPGDGHDAEDRSFTMRHPSRRIWTWTCGSTTKPRSRSASVSLVNNDGGGVEEASADDDGDNVAPKPWIPTKRGRTTETTTTSSSTSGSSRAVQTGRKKDTSYSAENMSMIELPFHAAHVDGAQNETEDPHDDTDSDVVHVGDAHPGDVDASSVGEHGEETSETESFSSTAVERSGDTVVSSDRTLEVVGGDRGRGKVDFEVDLWYRVVPRTGSRSCEEL